MPTVSDQCIGNRQTCVLISLPPIIKLVLPLHPNTNRAYQLTTWILQLPFIKVIVRIW